VASGDTDAIKEMHNGATVGLLGVVSAIKKKIDKKGRPMAFVAVEDFAGSMEVVLFASVYEKVSEVLLEDRVILFQGKLDRRDAESVPKLMGEEAHDFENSRDKLSHTLLLRVPLADSNEERLAKVRELLLRYPGKGEVVLHMELATGRRVRVRAGSARVGVHSELIESLRSLLGEDAVRWSEASTGRNGR
jgi:DNA polymerase-3 subunit alpha